MSLTTRPLFQFDPGWLFIMAGLAICAAGIILPAQADLEALQRQLDKLLAEEGQAYARLKAHADFLDEVDRSNPALIKRLAQAQLNLVPGGDTPVLLADTDTSPVTTWIDSTVQVDIRPANVVTRSALSRIANGPDRLWMFGGGIMSVFIGLMLHAGPVRRRRRSDAAAMLEAPVVVDADEAMLAAAPEAARSVALLEAEPVEEDDDGAIATEMGEFVPDVIELPATLVETKQEAVSSAPDTWADDGGSLAESVESDKPAESLSAADSAQSAPPIGDLGARKIADDESPLAGSSEQAAPGNILAVESGDEEADADADDEAVASIDEPIDESGNLIDLRDGTRPERQQASVLKFIEADDEAEEVEDADEADEESDDAGSADDEGDDVGYELDDDDEEGHRPFEGRFDR